MSADQQENQVQFEQQFKLAKKENVNRFRNDLLLKEIRNAENQQESLSRKLDEAIRLKYKQVSEYITISSFTLTSIPQTLLHMRTTRSEIRETQQKLDTMIEARVKIIFELLNTTWTVIARYRYQAQRDKNVAFDEHYANLVDVMLIKAKTLQLSVLIGTYNDPEFITALETLRHVYDLDLLEKRCREAETMLKHTTQKIDEYNEVGPEFKTLLVAYRGLLDEIQATKDDIDRIRETSTFPG